MELAKNKGTVRPDKGRFMIDIWVGTERYKLRHLPVVGGGWLPFMDEATAEGALTMIRAAIAGGASEMQAIAPSPALMSRLGVGLRARAPKFPG